MHTSKLSNTQKQTSGISRSHSKHSRRISSRKKIKKLKLLIGLLIGLIVIIMVFLILKTAKSSKHESIKNQLQITLNKQENALEQTEKKLAAIEAKLKILVTGRIPNLQPLEFDKSIAIEREYLRNIIFTLTGVGQNNSYEYRIVAKNDSLHVVEPSITIFLFDDVGIQVGKTTLSKQNATSEVKSEDLEPGETRAYSSIIPLERDAEPKYFLITLKPRKSS